MNVQISIPVTDLNQFASGLESAFDELKPIVHEAMGKRFYALVQGNFGIAGVDRPMTWAPLSPAYARKVGREIATLHLSGALRDAIMIGGFEGESVTVSVSDSSVPYATVHQTGSARMPKRPYFPIDDNGEVMPYTAGEVKQAAQDALERELQ